MALTTKIKASSLRVGDRIRMSSGSVRLVESVSRDGHVVEYVTTDPVTQKASRSYAIADTDLVIIAE